MSGVNECWGASWREELDDKEIRGMLGGECALELRGYAVSWNFVDPPFNTIYYSVVG